jgi:metal-dependent HD superfamily phosphatase/phosphodiesterase
MEYRNVTFEEVKASLTIQTFVAKANEHLAAIGFTEHGPRHVGLVANISRQVIERLGYEGRLPELAAIAGYTHDIGNVSSRHDHGQTSACLLYPILSSLGMPPDEVAIVLGAVGNHEEEYGEPMNVVGAALILADKSDVHRSRVRNHDVATFDIHDRVNYAVTHSFLEVTGDPRVAQLRLTIDTDVCPVMDYFEIFLQRMMMCRRAAHLLEADFQIIVNETRFL